MAYSEEDVLLLSGIQHFAFCRRQWALIHVEQQWQENIHTVEGNLFHARAHDESAAELRGDRLILRGLRVHSNRLGITGQCDVVEFTADPDGVTLFGRQGRWAPHPVEYKKGKPKPHQADEMQLCAQAICLEEMFACVIREGDLFYGEPHRRTQVEFTEELRHEVENAFSEMHEYLRRGHTPKVKRNKACKLCSLQDICTPGLAHKDVAAYIREEIGGPDP